jgi:DNA-binding Lrp family transcriptional regulator
MSAKNRSQKERTQLIEKNGTRKLTFAELASMLHGLLFAYEKVFINLHGDDVRQLYPYIIDEMAHILHSGEDPVIDPEKSLEENIDRVLYFISNEEYIRDLDFRKTDDNKYVFEIGACSFAKSGVHDILKIKEGICPFALVIASCLTELSPEGYARITKCEFDDEGSKAYIVTIPGEEAEDERIKSLHSEIDEQIFNAPDSKSPLDDLDMNIIKELRKDERRSNVDIAGRLGTSESTIRRRIDNLVERGIIRGFTTLLRYAPGDTFLRAFLGIKVDPTHMDAVIERLTKMKETCSVYKAIGKHNLICETIFNSRSKFQEFIDELQYVEGVMDVDYSIGSSAPKPCPWYGF